MFNNLVCHRISGHQFWWDEILVCHSIVLPQFRSALFWCASCSFSCSTALVCTVSLSHNFGFFFSVGTTNAVLFAAALYATILCATVLCATVLLYPSFVCYDFCAPHFCAPYFCCATIFACHNSCLSKFCVP